MAEFNVVIDTKVLEQRLSKLEQKQLPFARMLAANQAAFETRGTVQKAMPLFIDDPTSFTVRGVRYRKATKEHPFSEVYISGDGVKGTAPAKYLTIARGGRRGQRRSERVLTRAGIISADEGWVPGKDIRLNRFGNLTGGRITQILSQVRAFGEEGFQANVTPTSRSRGKRRNRKQYFLSRGDHLPRGIYERYGRKKSKARPVLIFIKLPTYDLDFDFTGITAREARRRFLAAWPRALQRALSTARR